VVVSSLGVCSAFIYLSSFTVNLRLTLKG